MIILCIVLVNAFRDCLLVQFFIFYIIIIILMRKNINFIELESWKLGSFVFESFEIISNELVTIQFFLVF